MKALRMSYLKSYELCPYLTKELYGTLDEDGGLDFDEDDYGIYAEFGILLHELFEKWGRTKIAGKEYTIEQMITDYERKLVTVKNPYPDGKERDFIVAGYNQIEYFYDTYALSTPLDVEHKFEGEHLIDEIPLPFLGTLDRIDGNLEDEYIDVEDYKTGNHATYTKSELRDNIQATIYSLYVKKHFGYYPHSFTFYFTKTKKEKTIFINDEFIKRGKERIMLDYRRMKAGLWETTGSHSDYFCKNFCVSKTCEKKKNQRQMGWNEMRKAGKHK